MKENFKDIRKNDIQKKEIYEKSKERKDGNEKKCFVKENFQDIKKTT